MSFVDATITATRNDDGSITVDGFPEKIRVSQSFLSSAEKPWFQWSATMDGFHLLATNGHAEYRFFREDPLGAGWYAQRIRLDKPP